MKIFWQYRLLRSRCLARQFGARTSRQAVHIKRHGARQSSGRAAGLRAQQCVPASEKVVWRTRVLDADGKVLGKDDLKSVVVELQDGKKVEAAFGGHPPRAPTDNLWAAAWIVPADYPTGTFNYKVTATDNKGNSVTWEPFKVASSQLRIEAGAIEIKE